MPQPLEAVAQIAYVVDDLEAAIQRWVGAMSAGPFFLLEHLAFVEPRYRGAPTPVDLSIALGYSGSLCIELIVQHCDSPSVFREKAGGGFHHWAVMTERFDEQVARWEKRGAAIAFDGAVAVGGRFAYADTSAGLGGMLELIELTPPVRELFGAIEQASVAWDGRDPVRRFT